MNYVTSRFPPLTSRSFSRQLSFLVFKAEVCRPCIPSSPSFPFFSSSFHTTVISFPRDSSNESSGPRSRKGGTREPKEAPNMRLITKGEKYEPVDLETSKEYLKSEAYAKTYEGKPIWHETLYRRNFKGPYNPIRTRPDCYRNAVLCNNPCPICRDDHLLVHHENLDLLKQFIEPQTGAIISHRKTNACLLQHSRIEIAIGRARDRGLLEMRVPHRDYDYAEYYPKELLEESDYEDILSPAEVSFLAKTKDVAERQLGRNDVLFQGAFQVDDDDDLIDYSGGSDSDSERNKSY